MPYELSGIDIAVRETSANEKNICLPLRGRRSPTLSDESRREPPRRRTRDPEVTPKTLFQSA